MSQILKNDKWSFIVLDNGIIRKTVRKVKPSERIWNKTITDAVTREVKSLKRLKGIEGIREVIKRESENTFTSFYIPGMHLKEYKGRLPSSYFDELSSMLKECCRRGVYDIDLNRKNLLVRHVNGALRPGIIDFGIILFSNKWEIPGTNIAKMYHLLQVYGLSRRYNHL